MVDLQHSIPKLPGYYVDYRMCFGFYLANGDDREDEVSGVGGGASGARGSATRLMFGRTWWACGVSFACVRLWVCKHAIQGNESLEKKLVTYFFC